MPGSGSQTGDHRRTEGWVWRARGPSFAEKAGGGKRVDGGEKEGARRGE